MVKYRFLAALDKIVGTERKIKNVDKGNFWFTYDAENNRLLNAEGSKKISWPSIETQQAKIWEVEEVPIYVWGVCDNNGDSWIYDSKPIKVGVIWEDDDGYTSTRLEDSDLFPKNKPQKFKLVPVED